MKIFYIFLSLAATALASYSQSPVQEECSIFADLTSVVLGDSIQENDPVVPSDLIDIVCDYYAEATVDDEVAANVLDYITGAYRDHGYYDTGNWAPPVRKNYYNYLKYSGELPEYENQDFVAPAQGKFSSHFGYRPKFGRFHHGIDIALNTGDTVGCSLPGVVIKTGYESGGYGRYVVVAHAGGMETLYGHLQVSLVNPGDKLKAGDPLGLGGATGNATGAHLHFETRYRGTPINPLSMFPFRP